MSSPLLELAANFYNRAEVRTAVTPPVAVEIGALGGEEGPGLLVRLLRPTVVLTGPAGTQVVAPAGEASRYGGVVLVAAALAVLGVAFGLGMAVGRR